MPAHWSPTAPQWDTRPTGEKRGGGGGATSDGPGCRVYHVNLLQATEPERAHALEWSRKSAELPPQAWASSTLFPLTHPLTFSEAKIHSKHICYRSSPCSRIIIGRVPQKIWKTLTGDLIFKDFLIFPSQSLLLTETIQIQKKKKKTHCYFCTMSICWCLENK